MPAGRGMFRTLSNIFRSSPPEVFLGKDVLKICSKFTGEYPFRSVISKKLFCTFVEITFRHGCSPVNLLHIFRTPFPKNTSGGLLLIFGGVFWRGLFHRFLKTSLIDQLVITELMNHPSMTDNYLNDKITIFSNILKYTGSISENIEGNNLEQLNIQLYQNMTA